MFRGFPLCLPVSLTPTYPHWFFVGLFNDVWHVVKKATTILTTLFVGASKYIVKLYISFLGLQQEAGWWWLNFVNFFV